MTRVTPLQAERRDMERQFESAKFDLARKLLVEKVRVCVCDCATLAVARACFRS
jgi:hypothetical protein